MDLGAVVNNNMNEEQILQLPKRSNYHYNIEYINGAECMVLYYRLTDNMWNRHVNYCKDNGHNDNLNQWLRILVDVDDFEMIEGWGIGIVLAHLKPSCGNKTPYIQTCIGRRINKKQMHKSIHRHILNPSRELYVDHINHNSLDNRKCNLRLVTPSENMQNKNGSHSNSKTGIRGVSIRIDNRIKNYKYYVATVMLNNKRMFYKNFPFTPQGLKEAEQAVVEARLKYFTHSEMDK